MWTTDTDNFKFLFWGFYFSGIGYSAIYSSFIRRFFFPYAFYAHLESILSRDVNKFIKHHQFLAYEI